MPRQKERHDARPLTARLVQYSGMVQGVSFRASTALPARAYLVSGSDAQQTG
jgi:hypothetical protein